MTPADYLQNITQRYKQGNATEHSYRGDLQQLLQTLLPDALVTNEPKRQACGAPDYILTRNDLPIGFIEAKDVGDADLHGKRHNKEQFDRYKQSLGNVIFTDYLTFHWYKHTTYVTSVTLAELTDGVKPNKHALNEFAQFITHFATHATPEITSPSDLAAIMARKARFLASVIEQSLWEDARNNTPSSLSDQRDAFKQILIHDISERQFADMYAQTITYGFFTARYHDSTLPTFSRAEACELLPSSNPFLKKLFGYIAGFDLDDRIRWMVDDLVQVFLAVDVAEMLGGYKHKAAMEDPIMYFYEDFLAAYDTSLKKSRGVWYTPAPVVDFITCAVNELLKRDFGLSSGLADTSRITINANTPEEQKVHKVQILDPAAGTGAFLAQVIKQIHAVQKSQQGMWKQYVTQHLLPRVHGFELLMASYAVAHLKLDMILRETGADSTKERIGVYLTNSLEEDQPAQQAFAFARWLTDEANQASRIKRDMPVMVVLGNPPYSGESVNKGKWIMGLMQAYKQEPAGGRLQERNPKWINDDYVKFIRYGQHYIDKNGFGILAYICPHGFLDNPTFRGMRYALLKTFDDIYTIDLHGNSKKKETAPDGGKDDNVFDIQQGVAITLFVKTGKKAAAALGQVHHHDLYGSRTDKYEFLATHTLADVPFAPLPNKAPMYFMVPKNFALEEAYNKGFALNRLFVINGTGVVTKRDRLCIHQTKESCYEAAQDITQLEKPAFYTKYALPADVRDWRYEWAKQDVVDSGINPDLVQPIVYRPFDQRYIYYTGHSRGFIGWPVYKVMRHMLTGENVGLVFARQSTNDHWTAIQIVNAMTDNRFHCSYKGIPQQAPLYLYPDSGGIDTTSRTPNLEAKIVETFAAGLKLAFVPEKTNAANSFAPIDLLDYIYAVLHSPTYRDKYKAFLKIDFPRVPYPTDANLFWQLVQKGGELRGLHLLTSPLVDAVITHCPVAGDNLVDKITYQDERVFINQTQYFAGVPQSTWDFYIGGYQPAQKWLKDRKGMTLAYDDLLHYQKIITSLTHTLRVMGEIDQLLALETC